MNKISIGNKIIFEDAPVFVIAEMASSHEGRLSLAKKLLKKAVWAGADAVEFQILKADEMVSVHHHKYSAFRQIELSDKDWQRLFLYARDSKAAFVAEVFDLKSLKLMQDLGADAYKVHSSDLTNPYILDGVSRTKKGVFLSTGGSTLEEIAYAVRRIKSQGNKKIILLHGYQAFPTPIEETNFGFMLNLNKRFRLPVGFGDHSDAEHSFSKIMPLLATVLGSSVIEKHLTLDRDKRGRDWHSALNPEEFKNMVEDIRLAEDTLGVRRRFSALEERYRRVMKKSIVVRFDLAKGMKLKEDLICFKRAPKLGLLPSEIPKLLGKRLKRRIEKDRNILLEDLL